MEHKLICILCINRDHIFSNSVHNKYTGIKRLYIINYDNIINYIYSNFLNYN